MVGMAKKSPKTLAIFAQALAVLDKIRFRQN